MTLRTGLRAHPARRAIADTLAPCRCRSRIMTISPGRITGSPLPEGKALATQRRPTAPDRRPTSGNFQAALLESFAAAPTHSHGRALRSVADRLLAVACAMLKSQTTF